MDVVTLSRIQFGFTVSFHYIFPAITVGMSWLIVWMLGKYARAGDPVYRSMARFWLNIFALTFILGVATGVAMSFQFGTNWSGFSMVAGEVFGVPLVAEGVFGFFMEAIFLGLLVFGWDRLSVKALWFCSLMVAVGATSSIFWIVAANSWMQTPAGYRLTTGGFELVDFWKAVFNPSTMQRYVHVTAGVILAGAMFVMGMAAWFLKRSRHVEFAKRSLRPALILSFVAAAAQLPIGHWHAVQVAETQPAKLAAFEGLFETRTRAPLCLFGIPNEEEGRLDMAVGVPGLLSLGAFGSMDAEVKGLNDFPREDWPPLITSFGTFHLMVALGMYFILFTLLGVFLLWKRRLYRSRFFLTLAVFSIPLPIVANELGWAAAEFGRQPWIVYNVIRTSEAVSAGVPASHVFISTLMFGVIYALLFVLWIVAIRRRMRQGPEPVR